MAWTPLTLLLGSLSAGFVMSRRTKLGVNILNKGCHETSRCSGENEIYLKLKVLAKKNKYRDTRGVQAKRAS